jgi:phospholipid N-methyltransferase
MNPDFNYTGNELTLFASAGNWKKYFSSFIRKYIRGKILEVGPGIGSNTLLLNDPKKTESWLLLEPDQNFSNQLQLLKENKVLPQNCQVRHGTIFSLDPQQKFDAIIYIDVLEHIEKDVRELHRAIDLLNAGGHLLIVSPAYGFLYSHFDKAIGHYRRYNKKSLRRLADALPVKEVSLHYLDSAGMLLSFMNKIFLRQSLPTKNQIRTWDRFFVRISRLLDKLLFYRFGKTILGIWRKQGVIKV